MKKVTFLLVETLMVLTSCNSFLEEKPKSALPEDEAYNSIPNLYINAIASIYNYIGGNTDSQGIQGTGRGVYDFNTLTTDEAIMPTRGGDWYDGGFWQRLFLHKWGENDASLLATWEYLYKVVSLSNYYMEKVKAYQTIHDDAILDKYLAELRAVRAIYYYYIMDMFGRVPLVTSTSATTDSMTISDRATVYKFIVDELQAVAPLLSTERSNQSGDYYGRITRPVVYFILAKLCLNSEIYSDNDWTDNTRYDGKDIYFTVGDNKMNAWKATQAYCDSITSMGYKLDKKFTDCFVVNNQYSEENIFTIPMDKALYSNWFIYLFRSRHYSHGSAYGDASENGTSATVEALNTFAYGTDSIDPRFKLTYYADTVRDLNNKIIMLDDGHTPLIYRPREVALDATGTTYEKTCGARMKKYEVDPNANADGRLCANDIVLFRYADVLLMRSEAKVRNGENGDIELNEVRSRVGAKYRKATLDNILAERELELAWEGWRRNDLIRFGQFTRTYTDRPQLAGESDGYTTVFPIPEDILSRYSWKQNPGYPR